MIIKVKSNDTDLSIPLLDFVKIALSVDEFKVKLTNHIFKSFNGGSDVAPTLLLQEQEFEPKVEKSPSKLLEEKAEALEGQEIALIASMIKLEDGNKSLYEDKKYPDFSTRISNDMIESGKFTDFDIVQTYPSDLSKINDQHELETQDFDTIDKSQRRRQLTGETLRSSELSQVPITLKIRDLDSINDLLHTSDFMKNEISKLK